MAGRGGTRLRKRPAAEAARSGVYAKAANGSQIANKIMKSRRKEIGMNAVRIFQFHDPIRALATLRPIY